MDKTATGIEEVRSMKRGRPPKVKETVAQCDTISPAQDLCDRIWEGQSPDLPKREREERIKRALVAQGYDPHSVVIG